MKIHEAKEKLIKEHGEQGFFLGYKDMDKWKVLYCKGSDWFDMEKSVYLVGDTEIKLREHLIELNVLTGLGCWKLGSNDSGLYRIRESKQDL